MSTLKPITITGWPKGMDNIHADHEIPDDTLRRAVNVDVLDSGKLRRRKGFEQSLAISGAHSLWCENNGAGAYFVAADHLYRFFTDGAAQDLGAIGTGANRLSYVNQNGAIYFLSASARGRLVNGALDDWGVEVPTSPPLLSSVPGVLPAGTYLGAITYLLADGRESGASSLSSLALTEASGIGFYGLPVPTQAGVTKKRIYLSTADGEVLYRVAEVDAADTIATAGSYGAELRTAYLTPPPFGTGLIYALGRLFIIDGKTVWYTEAMDFDHVDKRRNFYRFAADVTLIAPADDGIYVCADQTYFIANAGQPDHSMRPVFEFGAIAGTLASMPTTCDAIWFTERGAVIGKNSGNVEIVSEKLVSPGSMTQAAGMVRESDGLRQFLVVGNGGSASGVQCGSYAEAEIIRRAQ